MNCKYFYLFLGNKKLKMTHQLIPSDHVSEIYLDMSQLNGNWLVLPQTVLNLAYTSWTLIKSFIKIKSLSEGFFCTVDIQTLNYCMHVYSQFIKKESLDFFISGHWKINLAYQTMKQELDRFLHQLEKLFQTFLTVIPKKSKF